jgi:hypothetical protein
MQGGGEVRGCGSSARRMVYVGVSAGVVSTAVIGYFSDPSRMALVAEGMGCGVVMRSVGGGICEDWTEEISCDRVDSSHVSG